MILFKFKSNPETIVRRLPGSRLVQIVWGKNWPYFGHGYIYRWNRDNLLRLDAKETKIILTLRVKAGFEE